MILPRGQWDKGGKTESGKNNKIISLLLGGRKALESVRIQLCIPSLCVCLKCRENTKQIGFQTTGEILVLQAVSISSSADK